MWLVVLVGSSVVLSSPVELSDGHSALQVEAEAELVPPPVPLQVTPTRYKASRSPDPGSVSLTLQADVNRLNRLESIASAWKGPISMAVLSRDKGETESIDRFWNDAPSVVREHVTLHLCEAQESFEFYPINVMRNHALHNAVTEWIYILDIDEQPMGSMDEHLKEVTRAQATLHPSRPVYAVFALQWAGNSAGAPFPSSRAQAKEMVAQGLVGVKAPHVKHGYSPADVPIDRWLELEEPVPVAYVDAYEPYSIVKRSQVLDFDPRFVGWGGNKHIQMLSMALDGFQFSMLPNVFSFADENPKTKTHSDPPDAKFVQEAFLELGKKYGCNECTLFDCVKQCPNQFHRAAPASLSFVVEGSTTLTNSDTMPVQGGEGAKVTEAMEADTRHT